jgi:hypothetical protein
MPAGILASPRGCICGTPDDFAGLDSLASQILASERRYNAAATPFGWKFTRTDLDQLPTGSPGTTFGNAPAPGSMMTPDELTGATAKAARLLDGRPREPGRAGLEGPTSTRPVDPDVVRVHGDVIVSEGSGDAVLRGEDVVAANRCQPAACPR